MDKEEIIIGRCTINKSDPKWKYIEETHNKNIVLKDERSPVKALFFNKNKEKIQKIYIDKCLTEIRDKRRRCDYGIRYKNKMWFIELKGKDVDKAISQLISTFEIFRKCNIFTQQCEIVPVIVLKRFPPIKNPKKKVAEKLIKFFKTTPCIKSLNATITIK